MTGTCRKTEYGIAVDIGTTTVDMSLVSLADGRELAEACEFNPQTLYGADVPARITCEYKRGEDGIRMLQDSIVSGLNRMIGELCREANVNRTQVKEIIVAANCTMTHMLLGVDARSIGVSPYRPQFTDAKELPAAKIGIEAGEHTKLYCLPHASAYIGADIVAGVHVCGLAEETGNVLFIDIGTNGEIVLAADGKLLCCSCAAGPALEGMLISCGTRASGGAIEDVHITEEGVKLTTIGDAKPAGICGSGILALVKELLRTGLIDRTGAFIKKESLDENDYRFPLIQTNGKTREFVLSESPGLTITQGDIREVQLTKGALLSGVTALLKEAGLKAADLDKALVAGQFGAHLSAESLTGAGILPPETGDKIEYAGNTSRKGAYAALMSEAARRGMETLAGRMKYIELANIEGYEQLFVECTSF